MTMTSTALNQALRKLWSDHVIWTRLYVIAAVDGPQGLTAAAERLPLGESGSIVASTAQAALGAAPAGAADAAAARLLRNQDEIGNAVVPFYGEDAGRGLTDLLKQHIMIAVELVAAAKAGDNERFADHDKKWDDNAHEIARFLSGANPNWPEQAVYDLLDQHLRLTKGEVTARLTKDWNADVKAFDDIYTEAMVIADTLAAGIIKQFPDQVSA
jgi:hypothetical protein